MAYRDPSAERKTAAPDSPTVTAVQPSPGNRAHGGGTDSTMAVSLAPKRPASTVDVGTRDPLDKGGAVVRSASTVVRRTLDVRVPTFPARSR
ncbi:hypothetical protein GCM10027294_24830 [Marinactinospora endophytica]